MYSDPKQIKHYRIGKKLGQGGMGIVYAAEDERLHRPVAIKMILDAGRDATARERFWREARVAAAVNHPNVCQLYEIDDYEGHPYLVMELLEGSSLTDRLTGGPFEVAEALSLTLSILGALDALHERHIVHRDLKPSNIFLTKFGVKLLDFGLARPIATDDALTGQDLTMPGKVVGTPAYMAPEQLSGQAVDTRVDLFATGAILYEMLSGRPMFGGRSMVDTMHAVLHERPPALTGSASVGVVDGVIQRALEKQPAARYQTAEEMSTDIRSAMTFSTTSTERPVARVVTRVIVLPFRVLRPDPDTDFLAFGLADAIMNSLTGVQSLVVRSSLAASAFSEGPPDLQRIATETGVEAVVTGTLMRAGDQIRVNAQLLEAPGGTVLWSDRVQSPLGDLFKLQDDFTRRIVESLSIPLTRREEQLMGRDVPASARAYEFYLRGNECARTRDTWQVAYDLYNQCLEEDPQFAPAWARLGRMERLVGLHFDADHADDRLAAAERAFQRALELNPDLSLAHHFYAHLEVDLGRGTEAMLRLLDRTRQQRADPELYAGLVHVCRYCGLLEASIAAYEKARRLDPTIRTSVCHTYWFAGEVDRAIETDDSENRFMHYLAQIRRGDKAVVLDDLRRLSVRDGTAHSRGWERLVAALTGDRAGYERGLDAEVKRMRDPENIYYWAVMAALVGDADRLFELLRLTLDRGWMCYRAMMTEPTFDRFRADSRMSAVVRDMEARQRDAAAAFFGAGGDRLLNLKS